MIRADHYDILIKTNCDTQPQANLINYKKKLRKDGIWQVKDDSWEKDRTLIMLPGHGSCSKHPYDNTSDNTIILSEASFCYYYY